MKFPTLYGKDSRGELKIWEVSVDGNNIIVRHGKLGGKIQEKVTQAFGKNKGRSNETTDNEQAVLEAKAKHTKQKKQGYFETKEDALGFVEFAPMRCLNYKDYASKVIYPVYCSPKIDGMRIMISPDGECFSKQGEPLSLPKHWEPLREVAKEYGGLDGEVYAGLVKRGGLPLQDIISAFRKENQNTIKLKMYVYDIPDATLSAVERHAKLLDLKKKTMLYDGCLVVNKGYLVHSEEEGDRYYDLCVKEGYEGVVYRNLKGMYEFGKQSHDMIKRKPRGDIEAKVLLVSKDKNNQGLLLCELENGIQFECLMRKDADNEVNYRLYDNAVLLVNKYITVAFEDYSNAGKPLKPVGIAIRQMDSALRPVF